MKKLATFLVATALFSSPSLADTRKAAVSPGAQKSYDVSIGNNATIFLNLAWANKATDLDVGLLCSGNFLGGTIGFGDRHESFTISIPGPASCTVFVANFGGPRSKFWINIEATGGSIPILGESDPLAILSPEHQSAVDEMRALATILGK